MTAVLARLLLLAGFVGGVPLAAGWYVARELTGRRTPDPVQHPDRYGLEGDAVHFLARDGVAVRGWWLPAETPRGTIIIAHGQSGSLDGDLHLAPAFVQRGFNVLMFDFRAHGRSAGSVVTFGSGEVLDLRGALDWLESERGVRQAGVLGLSMGAGVALTTAAHDCRITALVVDCPFYRLHTIIAAGLRDSGVPALVAHPLARFALRLASRSIGNAPDVAEPARWAARVEAPVLMIAAGSDRFIPHHETQALYRSLPSSSDLWIVPGVDHRETYQVDPDDYVRRTAGWFEMHLHENVPDPHTFSTE